MTIAETIACSGLRENWVKNYTMKNRLSKVIVKTVERVRIRDVVYFKAHLRHQKTSNFFDFRANSETITCSLSSKAANFKFLILDVFRFSIKLCGAGESLPSRFFSFRSNISIPIRENRF